METVSPTVIYAIVLIVPILLGQYFFFYVYLTWLKKFERNHGRHVKFDLIIFLRISLVVLMVPGLGAVYACLLALLITFSNRLYSLFTKKSE